MTKVWTVDAFTNEAYAGNPAAVMIVSEFPKNVQQIASEINLSETAFVKILSDTHAHIRWLTPTVEVPLCGHATLAAAHILFQEALVKGSVISFESLSGKLYVTKEEKGLMLDFPLQPTTTQLAIEPYEIALNAKGKIDEVIKAYDDVIVRIKSEDDIYALKPDFIKLLQLDGRGVIATATSKDYDFISRFFNPACGINEDPVTGSSHCKLADYWSKKLGKDTFSAYQASSRGGYMLIHIKDKRVFMKSTAITIMEGHWLAPIDL